MGRGCTAMGGLGLTMKKKSFKQLEQKLDHSKDWCSYCQKKTMVKKPELYLKEIELWECAKCKLLERYKI